MAKFRSWNKEMKCFIFFEDGKYFIQEFEKCKVKENLLDLFNWQNKQQFTEKTDNNNVEIYEGDFLNTEHPRGIEDITYLVGWSNESNSYVITKGDYIEHQLTDIEDDCVVINSIHSNECYNPLEEVIYDAAAMGCGLEDQGITDKYEAMEYGFNQALEQLYDITN